MALQILDRVVLIKVKTEWAKKHLRNLAAEALTVTETAVLIADEKTGIPPHPIGILWGDFPMVPTISFDAICMAGDVIHNLRSALDHLAQHLALVNTPTLTSKELRGVEFPISETLAEYKSPGTKARKVKGIHPRAIEAIDRFEPYGGGNGQFSTLLWRLHALDNIDKHRNLFTVGPEAVFTLSWLPGVYHLKTDNPDFSQFGADVEKDFQSGVNETISKTKVGQAEALIPALNELVEMVESIVWKFREFLE
jgi:hypothetical protein